MHRRTFGTYVLFAIAALLIPFGIVGCDAPSLINYINLTLGLILTIATPFLPPGVSVIAGLVKAGLADLSATITEYEADTNPADKATTWAKIETIVTDVIANFQQFIATILPNAGALVSLIETLAQDVLGAITGLVDKLKPAAVVAPAPVAAAKAGKLKIAGTAIAVVPWACTAKQYKARVNGELAAAGHPELALK
jgi:hypothetical protein